MDELARFRKNQVRIGTITILCGMIANFIPAVFFYLAYGVGPSAGDIVTIWTLAAITYAVSWFIQPVTFFSMLGISGTYIGWLAGNCADIRAPAVTMAQKAAGYEPGTPEGDVMAVIGITGSIFVSVTIITLFTIIGDSVLAMVPPAVTAGFKYILPAVFGAVYAQLSLKHLKVGAITIAIGFVIAYVFKMVHIPNYVLNIVLILLGVAVSRVEYVRNKK